MIVVYMDPMAKILGKGKIRGGIRHGVLQRLKRVQDSEPPSKSLPHILWLFWLYYSGLWRPAINKHVRGDEQTEGRNKASLSEAGHAAITTARTCLAALPRAKDL